MVLRRKEEKKKEKRKRKLDYKELCDFVDTALKIPFGLPTTKFSIKCKGLKINHKIERGNEIFLKLYDSYDLKNVKNCDFWFSVKKFWGQN